MYLKTKILRRCWYAASLVYGVPTTEVNEALVVGWQGCYISTHTNNGVKN
jgi:hypothetical protein